VLLILLAMLLVAAGAARGQAEDLGAVAQPGGPQPGAFQPGQPGAAGQRGAQHGPYAEWTRKIGGKTVTRRLTPEQLTAWQPLFDNAKKLRTLLAELQELTLAIIEASESPPA
jgi:Family of unknown function (DUF6788)